MSHSRRTRRLRLLDLNIILRPQFRSWCALRTQIILILMPFETEGLYIFIREGKIVFKYSSRLSTNSSECENQEKYLEDENVLSGMRFILLNGGVLPFGFRIGWLGFRIGWLFTMFSGPPILALFNLVRVLRIGKGIEGTTYVGKTLCIYNM